MTAIRINTWSSPRNVSTALMYSFAQRPDTTVVDEPLYAHYLKNTDTKAVHPRADAILATMENSGRRVVEKTVLGPVSTKVLFLKQMTHHLIELDWSFLKKTKNVLLIRNPRRIIASYTKVIDNPTIEDVGIKKQYELFQYLVAAGQTPVVVDARELLLNPPVVLRKICAQLAIPFLDTMLRWEAGPIPEDGVWAPDWYANVHRSTGFIPYQEKEVKLKGAAAELADTCQPYYNFLYPFALRAF